MARFLPLQVSDVRRETRDAVVVTLTPQAKDEEAFDFIQGQYLTFRREFDGEELRRSYSICAGRNEGALQVGIKRVEGGCFSTWANEELKVGETIEAMPPMGAFHTAIDPSQARNYLFFAAGSGITPVLSLIKTTLADEANSNVTLVYGNRSTNTIMFRDELDDLKNRYMARLSVVHILGSEAQEIDLFSGRIDAEKCKSLFKSWIDIASMDLSFICGPEQMMLAIAQSLRDHGLNDSQIKFELFASSQPGRASRKTLARNSSGIDATCKATITIDGTTREISMAKKGETILEAALGANLDAPYACKAGVCSTCRAMVLEGEVEMEKNHALEDYEVNRGYVLTCQCFPISDSVVVSYDQ